MSQPVHRDPPVLGTFVALLVFVLALAFVGRLRGHGDPASKTGATPAKREAEEPLSPQPAAPPSDNPDEETRDEPLDHPRSAGGRSSYVPIRDPRSWTLQPSQRELRSKQFDKVADELLNQCLGETADGCWLEFEMSLARLTPLKHYIDAEGRLHPISTGNRQEQGPPFFGPPEDLNKRFPPPEIRPALREKLRVEWMAAFRKCLRWDSTGMCRMRNDGALEAEFKLLLDMEKGFELLPPTPTCFTRKEIDQLAETSVNPPKKDDPASKNPAKEVLGEMFDSYLIELQPIELFAFVMAARKTDESRRELIETKFHLAVMQFCRIRWSTQQEFELNCPHKWAVVAQP